MAGQREKVPKAELRIEEITGSSGMIVRLQGVSVATAPRVGEKIELKKGKFKVVEPKSATPGQPQWCGTFGNARE